MSLTSIATLLPALFICVIGMIVAALNYSKTPTPSVLTIAGCVAILGSDIAARMFFGLQLGLPGIAYTLASLVFSFIGACGIGAIIIAVFLERERPTKAY